MLRNVLKVAVRNLWRHKGYSAVNLIGLAAGMACFILIALWVRDEVSYDTFHDAADRIYRVVVTNKNNPSRGIARIGAPWGPGLKGDFPEIESYTRFRYFGRTLVRKDDVGFYDDTGLFADSTVFDVFSFDMLAGDPQTALTQPNSVVITREFAEKVFGEKGVLGRSFRLGGDIEYRVTGVIGNIPRNSHFHFSFLVPFLEYQRWDAHEWAVNNFHLYLKLREDADAGALQAKIPPFMERHLPPGRYQQSDIKLQPLLDIHLHSNLLREFEANGNIDSVYLFSMIALFILLIACINFTNLATARSARRAREVGIRKVVGSLRSQLMRQFIGETLFLSVLALVIALVLVEFLLPFFNDLSGKTVSLDLVSQPALIAFLVAVTLFVGFAAGAYPALLLSSFKPVKVLRQSFNPGSGRSMLRKVLVIAQFTISIALIAGTGIVYRQLEFISNRKLGFEKEQVMVMRVAGDARNEIEILKQRLLQTPGVLAASASSNLLGGSDYGMPLEYEGAPEGQNFQTRILIGDHDFVSALQMELIRGRNFSKEFSTDADAYLINEAAAKALPWDDPVGKTLGRPYERDPEGGWRHKYGHIVGIVKDFHFRSLHEQIQPMVIYMDADSYRFISLRLRADSVRESVASIEDIWHRFAPDRPFDYFFMDEMFDKLYRAEQRFGKTFIAFSVLAVVIACLGLFGLASFTAEQKTKEIGIRKTLGASVASIIFLLGKDFSKWVLIANAIAWPLAFWGMQKWLQAFAYRIEPEMSTFLFAGCVTLLIAIITVSVQSMRAALVNPVRALRYE